MESEIEDVEYFAAFQTQDCILLLGAKRDILLQGQAACPAASYGMYD